MKRRSLLLLVALSFARIGVYGADLRAVPFELKTQRFEQGDSIVIDEVIATSAQLKIGDTVVVRGHFRLRSKSQATLGLSVTTEGRSEPTPLAPKQLLLVAEGSGTFELQYVVIAGGALHVSFYPRPSGSSFGGLYFGPAFP